MINIFVTLGANFRNSQIFRINKSKLDFIFSRKSSLSKITFGWCFCTDVCEGGSAIVCRLLQLQACNVGADNWASHAVRRLLSTLGGYFQGIRIYISLLLIVVIITIYFIYLTIITLTETFYKLSHHLGLVDFIKTSSCRWKFLLNSLPNKLVSSGSFAVFSRALKEMELVKFIKGKTSEM